ncbi:MAG: c-type cytochrome [Burkholderiaceae bacterium]
MSSFRERPPRRRPAPHRAGAGAGSLFAALIFCGLAGLIGDAAAQSTYPGIGRAATPKELAAWDIDVRPDFKGLPKGSGSVSQGQDIWETKCASCHGVFGESNEVFAPLVGGTTRQDVQKGRVARLTDASFPGRTTLMKVPTLSTLWDYIRRAMPWTTPKSLSDDEVYAVTAYLLHLGEIVPADFVLSDSNVAATQKLMPNRDGMTTDHGMWPGKGLGNGGKPDVRARACMKDCATEPKVASLLPEHARNNHGNLAEQQRLVGPQRGADTTRPAGDAPAAAAAAAAARSVAAAGSGGGNAAAGMGGSSGQGAAGGAAGAAAGSSPAAALALVQKHGCSACHGVDSKLVGPGLREIAGKYAGKEKARDYLASKIRAGGQGVWGAIPMPPQSLSEADAGVIAQWLADGAKAR